MTDRARTIDQKRPKPMQSDEEAKATAKKKGAAKKMGKALYFLKLTNKTQASRSRVKQKT